MFFWPIRKSTRHWLDKSIGLIGRRRFFRGLFFFLYSLGPTMEIENKHFFFKFQFKNLPPHLPVKHQFVGSGCSLLFNWPLQFITTKPGNFSLVLTFKDRISVKNMPINRHFLFFSNRFSHCPSFSWHYWLLFWWHQGDSKRDSAAWEWEKLAI